MRLVPKAQYGRQFIAQSDNTRVARPAIERKVQYKLKPGEFFFTDKNTGKKTLIKPKNETINTDRRSAYQRYQDQIRAKQFYRQYEEDKKYEEGMRNLQGFLTFATPSTWVGAATRNNGRSYFDNVASGEGTGSVAGNVAIDMLTPFAIGGTKSLASNAVKLGNSIYYSNRPIGQYARFVGGKFKYGFDAKLPDLIRRTENPMPKLYQMRRNSPIVVSPIENRFRFKSTGKQSPVITNFTTDLPVISNNGGSWEGFDINIINGNQLLGKNVISTKPMDTFTYGNKIIVPRRAIKTISSKQGTVPEKQLMQKFLETYRRPTLKDYQFMDYVFQPKHSSEVIPNTPLTFDNMSTHPLGDYLSDADMRTRLNQPWENVMYDIAPPVESEFRDNLGIVLKSELHR